MPTFVVVILLFVLFSVGGSSDNEFSPVELGGISKAPTFEMPLDSSSPSRNEQARSLNAKELTGEVNDSPKVSSGGTLTKATSLSIDRVSETAPSPSVTAPPSPSKPVSSPETRQNNDAIYMVRLDSDANELGQYVIRLNHTGSNVEASSFVLDNPQRLVVDLDGRWPKRPGNVQGDRTYGVAGVARMRVGRKAEALRIVIDLDSEASFVHTVKSRGDLVEITVQAD